MISSSEIEWGNGGIISGLSTNDTKSMKEKEKKGG